MEDRHSREEPQKTSGATRDVSEKQCGPCERVVRMAHSALCSSMDYKMQISAEYSLYV